MRQFECVLHFECFYISERSNAVILPFSREENIVDIFFTHTYEESKTQKRSSMHLVLYSDSLLFYIIGIFLVNIIIVCFVLILFYSVLSFLFSGIIKLILNLLLCYDFGCEILKLCSSELAILSLAQKLFFNFISVFLSIKIGRMLHAAVGSPQ